MLNQPNTIPERFIIPPTCRERFLPLHAPGLQTLRQYGVELAGVSALQTPFEIGRQAPPFHLALMTIAGQAAFRTETMHGVMHPGDTWVFPAGQSHQYWTTQEWQLAWFHLSDSDRWCPLRQECAQSLPFLHQLQVYLAMEGLLAETLSGKADQALTVPTYSQLIAVLLDRLLHRFADAKAAHMRLALRTLKEAVTAQPAYPWSNATLAAQLQVSVATLKRLTDQVEGMAPMALVTHLRMQLARELLHSTNYTLERIAQAVGYATPFSFSRAFQRHSGSYPQAYRQALGKSSEGLSACSGDNISKECEIIAK